MFKKSRYQYIQINKTGMSICNNIKNNLFIICAQYIHLNNIFYNFRLSVRSNLWKGWIDLSGSFTGR